MIDIHESTEGFAMKKGSKHTEATKALMRKRRKENEATRRPRRTKEQIAEDNLLRAEQERARIVEYEVKRELRRLENAKEAARIKAEVAARVAKEQQDAADRARYPWLRHSRIRLLGHV